MKRVSRYKVVNYVKPSRKCQLPQRRSDPPLSYPEKEQIPSKLLEPSPPQRPNSRDPFISKMSRALKRLEGKYGASPIVSDDENKTPPIVAEFKSLWDNLPFFSFDILQKKLPQAKSAKKVTQMTGLPDRRKETLQFRIQIS